MAKKKLSERQKRMIEFIQDFWQDNGYPPTIREIGENCEISSTSVVNYNLNILEKNGYISRDGRVSRGIRLVTEPVVSERDSRLIPLAGRIFASQPVAMPDATSTFAPDEAISLTRELVGNEEGLFALQVQGDSMIDAMISDGDIVVMKPQITANNGDLVAVWLNDDTTTLKHFYKENGRVRLQPANPTMDPIFADPKNVQIQGKVMLVLRQYKV